MRKFVQGVVEIRSSKLGQLKQGAGRELGAGQEAGDGGKEQRARSREQGAGRGSLEWGAIYPITIASRSRRMN